MRNNKLREQAGIALIRTVILPICWVLKDPKHALKCSTQVAFFSACLFILTGYTRGSFFDTRYNYRNMAETVKKLKVEQEYCHRHFVQSSLYPIE